jgi:flagellar basal-body rod protein FlgB
MATFFSNIFGIHETSLSLRAHRAQVLADNLANADTPNYKARDVDFSKVLRYTETRMDPSRLQATHVRHLSAPAPLSVAGAELQYRVPMQPSLDGNTVNAELEQARFMDNALRYQASLRFVNGRVEGLLSAMRTE